MTKKTSRVPTPDRIWIPSDLRPGDRIEDSSGVVRDVTGYDGEHVETSDGCLYGPDGFRYHDNVDGHSRAWAVNVVRMATNTPKKTASALRAYSGPIWTALRNVRAELNAAEEAIRAEGDKAPGGFVHDDKVCGAIEKAIRRAEKSRAKAAKLDDPSDRQFFDGMLVGLKKAHKIHMLLGRKRV